MKDKTVYVMLVVHTEPPLDETGKSVPRIAKIAHSYKAPVTWVVTKDVAMDFGNPNCELSKLYGWSLKDFYMGTYDDSEIKDEVGAHLHPYTHFGIEYKRFKDGSSNIDNYAISMLTEEVQYKLIEELTDAITEYVGIPPKTFLPGRWAESQDGTTLRILERLGYTVDINHPFWKPLAGKSDWTGARYYQPYHPDRNNILQLGDSRVLLIPQTVLPPRISMSRKTLRVTDDKVLWPTAQNKAQMKRVFDHYYALKNDYSPIAIVIYMHSFDGVDTKRDIEAEIALENLKWLLDYASGKKDVVFVRVQDFVKAFYKKYGDKNPEKIYSIPAYTACLAKTFRSSRTWVLTIYSSFKRR